MKAKKNEKSKERAILKYFTIATSEAVLEPIRNVSLDDLFLSIYIKSGDDKEIEYLIKQYEKQLLLSKINFEKFNSGLHNFYVGMADYLKTNGLYKKFFELSYIHYIQLCKKKIKPEILSSYQNLLIQQFPYLTGTTKRVVCGVDGNGKLITVPEVGEYLTEINAELHLNILKNKMDISFDEVMIKTFRKYRYKVNSIRSCHEIIVDDQISTTMLYLMAYFINEETRLMISGPYRKAMSLIESNPIFEASECSDLIKEKLIHRQYLLPSTGVNALFGNNGDVKELLLKEIVENETVVLLFRLKFTDRTYTSGYYNSNEGIFYDAWKESSHNWCTHIPIENIVLQNYLNLTCTLTKEERQGLLWFKEIKDLKELDTTSNEVLVYYETKVTSAKDKMQIVSRHFDRAKYIAELMNISPFLRRLPVGANAGEEAIAVAKKLGIELPNGMTLVRGFTKEVLKKSIL